MVEPTQQQRARARFTALATGPDEAIDLGEAALWLAAEACPDLDVPACLARLDALADDVRSAVPTTGVLAERVDALNRILFDVHGFTGARDDYYDPRNSFLNEVLERRTGIPIALCVLYIEVARRLGLDAFGISFPGHFLAKVVGGEPPVEIIVDAFDGRTLTLAECAARLRSVLGPRAELDPALLRAARNKQILLRMLANLKAIYASRGEGEAALGCCDRSLLLAPDSAVEHRDRGLIYHSLDCPRPAVSDLERYLELAGDDEGAGEIRKLVALLRQTLPPVH